MNQLPPFILPLVAMLAVFSGNAAGQTPATPKLAPVANNNGFRHWKDDFSDSTSYENHWVPYGRLANMKWQQGIKGHWPDTGNFARPEWWQVVDSTLRAQNFPDEAHPAGNARRIEGDGDFRFQGRLKLAPECEAMFKFRGKSAGEFPPEKTDSHSIVLLVSGTGLKLTNMNSYRENAPQPATGAAAEKPEPARFRKSVFEKATENVAVIPAEWHELAMELRGKQFKAHLDGKEVLACTLDEEQRQTMVSFSLEVNGNKKETGVAWFDDFSFEAL